MGREGGRERRREGGMEGRNKGVKKRNVRVDGRVVKDASHTNTPS